jgi:hypothetical protein
MAASQVAVYSGAYSGQNTGVLLGNANVGSSNRDLGSICSTGVTGQASIGWTFTLNSASMPYGSLQITVVGVFPSGTAQTTETLNETNSYYGGYNNSSIYGGGFTSSNCVNNGLGYNGINNGYYGNGYLGNGYLNNGIGINAGVCNNGLGCNGLGYNGYLGNNLGYNGLGYNGLGYNGLGYNGFIGGGCGLNSTLGCGGGIYGGFYGYNNGLNGLGCGGLGLGGALFAPYCDPAFPTFTPGDVYVACNNGFGTLQAGPTGVTVTGTGATTATMTWAAAPNATGYTVFNGGVALGPASVPQAATVSGTTAFLTGFTPGASYALSVQASGTLGVSAMVPAVPSPFVCCAAGGGGGVAVTPIVAVAINPNGVGAVAGHCPATVSCQVSITWTNEPPGTVNQLLTGTTGAVNNGPACSTVGTSGGCLVTLTYPPFAQGGPLFYSATSTQNGTSGTGVIGPTVLPA